MVRSIKAWLISRRLRVATEARREALTACAEAKRRGDTRDMHRACERLADATHTAMRLELTLRALRTGSEPQRAGLMAGSR